MDMLNSQRVTILFYAQFLDSSMACSNRPIKKTLSHLITLIDW